MNKKELLLNAIEDLLAGKIDRSYALCDNICKKVNDSWLGYKTVKEFSKSWEHYSGEERYMDMEKSVFRSSGWKNRSG